jgi:nitroreductase
VQPWRVWVLDGAVRDEICRELTARYDRGEASKREYNYYPVKWREPYLARRRACGWGLYGTLGIGREDKTRMHAQHARNYAFFDAPVGLIFSIDRDLEMGSWLDYGMFLQSIMVAARAFGLETCPQAAWLIFHDVLQRRLAIPETQTIVCGMALGYADPADKVNTFTPERLPVGEFVTWVEGLKD